jgi:hypothetical protein
MDQGTIQMLAAAVTSKVSADFLQLLLGQLALTTICAALAAYAGGYLRRRGENLATKEDFRSLLDQLEANTRLVETVKAADLSRSLKNHKILNQRRSWLTGSTDSRIKESRRAA